MHLQIIQFRVVANSIQQIAIENLIYVVNIITNVTVRV